MNTFTTYSQSDPSVAMDADGDFVVAWTSEAQETGVFYPYFTGIFAQRYDSSGYAQGDEFQVNTSNLGRQDNPSVAMDANGSFVVVWRNDLYNAYLDSENVLHGFRADNIYSQYYDAAGVTQGGEFRVNTLMGRGLSSVAMDADGNFVVAYTSTESISPVYVRPYLGPNADAISAGDEYQLSEGGSVLLQGGAFFAQGGDQITYAWDIAGYENYTDLVGAAPTLTWEQALLLGIFDGTTGSTRTIRLRATNSLGESLYAEAELQIVNAGPSAALVGPLDLKVGVEAEFALWASDPSFIDQGQNFTFQIDWDGDGVDDETVVVPAGTSVRHTYARGGEYSVRLTAFDKEGEAGAASISPVVVSGWLTEPDPAAPAQTNLVWWGMRGGDAFVVVGRQGDAVIFVRWSSGGELALETASGVTGTILAYGQGGVDYLIAASNLPNVLAFHGGDGDDVLIGGLGGGLLDGGTGNDILLAQATSNGSIPLSGAPFTLLGGAGQDLLVAGLVRFADYGAETANIAAEWTSGRPFAERIANLSGAAGGANDGFFLEPGTSVFSNDAVDTALGGDDDDWLLYDFAVDLAPDAEPIDPRTDF